jgi:hypothetical protein
MLRHAVATIAYRGGKTVRGAAETFASFKVGESARTPAEILAHIADLFDWALSLATGAQVWHDSTTIVWERQVGRTFEAIQRFDAVLASEAPLACPAERLLQGPVADALTHVGQMAMLRGLAGSRVQPENYFKADITAGRVGPDQALPKREFD